MFMHVDPSNGIAIYDQIVRQVKFAVASEALKPGNLVPSVREMARDLTVNPNTVARAYRELQADNVLQPLRGTGLEVTAAAYKKCRDDRAALIRSRLRSVLEEARQSGLSADDVRALTDDRAFPARIEKGQVMTTAFSLSHVSKQFKRHLALDDVSLSSENGVVVALLGENGAGKTTAIRILLGPAGARCRRSPGPRPRQSAARARNSPPRGLRARSTGPLRLDDGRRGRLVRRRFLPARLSTSLPRTGRTLRAAPGPQDQRSLEGHAGQGLALAGDGPQTGAVDSRRADFGPRSDGPP